MQYPSTLLTMGQIASQFMIELEVKSWEPLPLNEEDLDVFLSTPEASSTWSNVLSHNFPSISQPTLSVSIHFIDLICEQWCQMAVGQKMEASSCGFHGQKREGGYRPLMSCPAEHTCICLLYITEQSVPSVCLCLEQGRP